MMKKLFFVTAILVLSGCGNPFQQKNSKQGAELAQDNRSDGLVHLDPVPGNNSSVGGFAPISPPTQGLIDIIESQQSVPQTVESEVTNSVSTVVDEVVSTAENVVENTEQVVGEVARETSDLVESAQNQTQEVVEQTEDVLDQTVRQGNDASIMPVVEDRVLENVLYIAPTVVVHEVVSEVVETANEAQEQLPELPVNVDPNSVESTSLTVPVVNNDSEEFEEDDLVDNSVQSTAQEMAKAVDSSVVEALSQINYSDSTAENTTITYEKKKGKMETYYVYSQSSNSYDWTKELAVYVEDGQIKLIQSLNKKDLAVFNVELAEIMAMEKDFSKKIKSKEVAPMKETVVSYVVKSKKNKKTFKLPNKKFGKKKGTKKHNKH